MCESLTRDYVCECVSVFMCASTYTCIKRNYTLLNNAYSIAMSHFQK